MNISNIQFTNFTNEINSSVSSTRIIYTPSAFARSALIHLQETGVLQAVYPHKSERSGLYSCLFFTVLSGAGQLAYGGSVYQLQLGDCVFIDCRKNTDMIQGLIVPLSGLSNGAISTAPT